MKRMMKFLAAAALALFAESGLAAHVPSRVLVVANEDVARGVVQRWNAHQNRIGNSNAYVVDLPKGYDEEAVRERIALDGVTVELDEFSTSTFVPTDLLYKNQWHLPYVNAAAAWDVTMGAGVVIAILDSGVQATHPDLAAHMVPGWNVYNNSNDTTDLNGHGTAVAGVAAAVTNNGIGVAGVAGGASIMPIRITAGDANNTTTFSIMSFGINYAADHGARVVNLSYMNAYRCASCISAAQYLQSKGGQLVASANNNSIDEGVAAVPSIVVVSALDKTGALASFSSWGNMVTMSAPGVDVETTIVGSLYNCLGCGAYGTSFATPIVAGVLALEFSANPSLTPQQAVSVLTSTATDLGTPGWDAQYGWGLVNAAAAVNAARNSAPVADTTAPVATISAPWPGTKIGINTKINVSATDNVGVASLAVYVDGVMKAVGITSALSYQWNSKNAAAGAHTITASAKDKAGNVGSKTITVYR